MADRNCCSLVVIALIFKYVRHNITKSEKMLSLSCQGLFVSKLKHLRIQEEYTKKKSIGTFIGINSSSENSD